VADYETEEEQIEALKDWWRENGNSLLIGVAVALVAVFGFRGWQTSVQEQGETASGLYQDLMETILIAPNELLDENKRSTGQYLVELLKEEHESSAYAKFASMFMAKQAVEGGDLDAAEKELRWVLDHDASDSIELVARLRLARVIFAKGDPQTALSLIESVEAGAHASSYEEIKGDIYLDMGRHEDAKNAYQQALNKLAQDASKPLLQMKLDDIAPLQDVQSTSRPDAGSTQSAGQTDPEDN
jgi:predicted negative regulator of RcsB-dependent stress response|tara:strand:+ start:616 stop:1344 length:729 start_codon:yes stop_codon:yes gene_type:complete